MQEYIDFCLADPLFYDVPRDRVDDEDFTAAKKTLPQGWTIVRDRDWFRCRRELSDLPSQGWKIHVSGHPDNAEPVVATVWDYCIQRGISFKFLRNKRIVRLRNSKYAPRGSSGKLITIYPRDQQELELICRELRGLLKGEEGPYILSDLRLGEGPLHVRYGAFVPRYRETNGEQAAVIEDPTGKLVPDVRGPAFQPPPWVKLPGFLAEHLEARNAVTTAELPYRIETALHFSNGGGVYCGRDKTSGQQVVLKEGRPFAGLAADGSDAITRLKNEAATLERLAGIDGVPKLLDSFSFGGHYFLVTEFIEGVPLNKELVRRFPLACSAVGETTLEEYTEWALGIHGKIEQTIQAIHRLGIVFGDLHLRNVLVRRDGGIALVDFEVASDVQAARRQTLAAHGFQAPSHCTGFEIDRYALACLRLALFLPLQGLLALDRGKAQHFSAIISEHFPVPEEWTSQAISVIANNDAIPYRQPFATERIESSWPEIRDSLAKAILASASPQRDDRLFPGDIAQFRTGGLNFAYGAAGVLYTLDVTGCGRFLAYEEWMLRQVRRSGSDTRFGFYDGLAGIAYCLHHLGHYDVALEILNASLSQPWESSSSDLYGGLAGLGLTFNYFAQATGRSSFHHAAMRVVDLVVGRLGHIGAALENEKIPAAGLLRGASGIALFLIRMYETTQEAVLLDYAAVALRQDLSRCVRRPSRELHVNEGWRTLPYLANGSIGIGLALTQYLAHRGDDEFADARDAIRESARSIFCAQPGLFHGRAGMMLYLSDQRLCTNAPAADALQQISRLFWHALRFQGHLAFPGEHLLRLSMDLATGAAGVLLALGAALHSAPVYLPFLGPTRPRMISAAKAVEQLAA